MVYRDDADSSAVDRSDTIVLRLPSAPAAVKHRRGSGAENRRNREEEHEKSLFRHTVVNCDVTERRLAARARRYPITRRIHKHLVLSAPRFSPPVCTPSLLPERTCSGSADTQFSSAPRDVGRGVASHEIRSVKIATV
ncbi:hypothetical protein EVAR_95646_1 [Eumeta japonica]|uniref:Uncharacterized protein n=1 Tax=Eumeta variegata TaxID=151549 RepID=A0A4C2ADE5_EUMVA|nr:hypothetical protein EVAR_95646_1 [Eumeta japonica]